MSVAIMLCIGEAASVFICVNNINNTHFNEYARVRYRPVGGAFAIDVDDAPTSLSGEVEERRASSRTNVSVKSSSSCSCVGPAVGGSFTAGICKCNMRRSNAVGYQNDNQFKPASPSLHSQTILVAAIRAAQCALAPHLVTAGSDALI